MGTLPSHLSPFEGTLLEMASGEYLFADLWPELSLMATPRCKGGRAFWLGTLPLRHWLVKQSSLPPEAKKYFYSRPKVHELLLTLLMGQNLKRSNFPTGDLHQNSGAGCSPTLSEPTLSFPWFYPSYQSHLDTFCSLSWRIRSEFSLPASPWQVLVVCLLVDTQS